MDTFMDTEQKIKSFKQTCEKPYIRHHYKLVYIDGREVIFDNYEDIQIIWFQNAGKFLSHIEVLDIKEKKKGFK